MKDKFNNMTRRRRMIFYIDILLAALTLAFIFGNSLESKAESQEISMTVLDKVKPILEPFVGSDNVTDHFVRKLAHFTEFAVLGTELAAMLAILQCISLQSICNCAFSGLTAALIDETIQIFSSRGSQVEDVLLDFAGFMTGAAFMLVFYAIMKLIFKKYNSHGAPSE